MRACQFLIILVLLSIAGVVNAQNPASADVHARLVLVGNKTVFRIGEEIRLALEFTAERDGYRVEFIPDGKTLGNDVLAISPDSGVTHWLDELNDNRPVPRHVYSHVDLSNQPVRIDIILNDTLRFDSPGRYTVSVTTRRLVPPSSWRGFVLTTNPVSFEIQPMSDAEEEQEVKRLSELLNTRGGARNDDELARQLSFLTGDPSTREKLRRFLFPDQRGGNYGEYIYCGLFIARNRMLVLKSLEAAMRDPNLPVNASLVGITTRLKTIVTHGVREKPADGITWFLEAPENPVAAEIREGYLVELAAGLAKRTGSNQTTTALTILSFLRKDSQLAAPALSEVRRIVAQQFDTFDPQTRNWLLQQHSDLLDSPALVTSLKKTLAATDQVSKNMHGVVFRRLIELAPEEARPYVIAEIRDPTSLVEPEILFGLKDESLPEVDASLLEHVRKFSALTQNRDHVYLKFKLHLLARFATNTIYRELMDLYRSVGQQVPLEERAGWLAYFAKHNEQEAMPLIDQSVSELKPNGNPRWLTDLTSLYYSESIGALLKKLLETGEVPQASHAAYLIGIHGVPGDEKVLEARLMRWRGQWRDRVLEVEAQHQGRLERELINALVNGKAWKLPEARVKELRSGCLTQLCKQK